MFEESTIFSKKKGTYQQEVLRKVLQCKLSSAKKVCGKINSNGYLVLLGLSKLKLKIFTSTNSKIKYLKCNKKILHTRGGKTNQLK